MTPPLWPCCVLSRYGSCSEVEPYHMIGLCKICMDSLQHAPGRSTLYVFYDVTTAEKAMQGMQPGPPSSQNAHSRPLRRR